jgi:hypothetical protein
MLGVTGTGATCSTGSATTIGTLTSLTINRAARYAATCAWSAGNTQDPTISGAAVYTDDDRHRDPVRDRLVPHLQLEYRRRQLRRPPPAASEAGGYPTRATL